MTTLPDVWSIKVVPKKFITLPWQDIERYGPHTFPDGRVTDAPPKGTVRAEGTVDIFESTLYEVAERTNDDYIMGNSPHYHVGQHEKWALVQSGLAVEETRGSIHGTPALDALLERLHKEAYATT